MTSSIKNRFGLYMDLLQSSNYFKLVCGAGNEDKNEVEYLTYVYTLAGCSGFDVSDNFGRVRCQSLLNERCARDAVSSDVGHFSNIGPFSESDVHMVERCDLAEK